MPEPFLEKKKIIVSFFQYENGTQPVRDWLLSELTVEERKSVGGDIRTVELEWPVGPPLVKKVGKVWEVRTQLQRGWARVFFIIEDGQMILLHGIIKKSKEIPTDDLDIIKTRLRLLTNLMEKSNATKRKTHRQ